MNLLRAARRVALIVHPRLIQLPGNVQVRVIHHKILEIVKSDGLVSRLTQQVAELSRFRVVFFLFLSRPSRHFIVLVALEYQMPA